MVPVAATAGRSRRSGRGHLPRSGRRSRSQSAGPSIRVNEPGAVSLARASRPISIMRDILRPAKNAVFPSDIPLRHDRASYSDCLPVCRALRGAVQPTVGCMYRKSTRNRLDVSESTSAIQIGRQGSGCAYARVSAPMRLSGIPSMTNPAVDDFGIENAEVPNLAQETSVPSSLATTGLAVTSTGHTWCLLATVGC